MGLRNSKTGWGAVSRTLHWTMVLLIAATLPLGWLANARQGQEGARALFDRHFQLGALIALLLALRLVWRAADRAPPPDAGVPPWSRRAARSTHALLYLSMIVMVASGYAIQIHMRPTLDILGLVQLPRPFDPGEDESLRAAAWYVHHYTLWLFLALIALHIGAALWHHFICRDGVLLRMLPGAGKDKEEG